MPGGGCGRPVWGGCGCALLLLAGAVAVFLLKADDFVLWWLGQAEQQVVQGLPPDLDPATRQRLESSFDRFREALLEGAGDPASLARTQSELGNAVRKAAANELTLADVERLIEALESAAGVESGARDGRRERQPTASHAGARPA